MSYRIEISPNNRATCSATHCKKEGVKIMKGEIRQAVLVPFQEHQSWKYRHWGCVTPEVLHNWWENAEKNLELIDGYDALPSEVQEKVNSALEQGHVDDEDWNGASAIFMAHAFNKANKMQDPECNRYTGKKGQGMFVKSSKNKKKKDDEEDEDEASPAKKKAPPKKRSREAENEKTEEVPPAKKPKVKKAAKTEDKDDELANAPPNKRPKAKKARNADIDEVEPKPTSKPKSQKAKKSDADEAEIKPAAKKGRKAKASAEQMASNETNAEAAKTAPQTRKTSRSKKAAAKDDE